MKKLYLMMSLFLLCASATALADDTDTYVATFENIEGITLDEDSAYLGSTEVYDSVHTDWDQYYCTYRQGPFKFMQYYAGGMFTFWTGFAVSACQSNDGSDNCGRVREYHSYPGGGYNGSSKFSVYYQGVSSTDSILIDKGYNIQGLYLANSAYSIDVCKNGDSYGPRALNKEGDYFMLTIVGYYNGEKKVSKDVTLAEYVDGELDYIDDWRWIDLSDFEGVNAITFEFSGTDVNTYFGTLNTPPYVCIDNVTAKTVTGVRNVETGNDKKVVARYSLNGTRLTAPQRGVNILRMADGSIRKVVVR